MFCLFAGWTNRGTVSLLIQMSFCSLVDKNLWFIFFVFCIVHGSFIPYRSGSGLTPGMPIDLAQYMNISQMQGSDQHAAAATDGNPFLDLLISQQQQVVCVLYRDVNCTIRGLKIDDAASSTTRCLYMNKKKLIGI